MGEGINFGCVVPHPPIMVPEVGGKEAMKVQASQRALEKLAEQMVELKPDVLILISPHGPARMDAMGIITCPRYEGDLSAFGAWQVRLSFRNDTRLVEAIRSECAADNIPLVAIERAGYRPDHGVVVPMYFLRRALSEEIPVIPLTFSWLPYTVHYAFGQAIQKAAKSDGRRVIFVASGDLSHRLLTTGPYGYDPRGPKFDEIVVDTIRRLDTQRLMTLDDEFVERAGECGLRSIIILLGALDGMMVSSQVYSYEGPFGVGYMVAALSPVQEATEAA